jgi:hypothetical protein
MSIITPIASQPIVEPNDTMSAPFRLWVQQVTGLQTLTGSGSPEGVVSAPITTLYMNTAGTAGSILYIKRDAAIAADPTTGWILV